MTQLTLLELVQCFVWAFFGVVPIAASILYGGLKMDRDHDDNGDFVILLFAVVAQIALAVALLKAGGK